MTCGSTREREAAVVDEPGELKPIGYAGLDPKDEAPLRDALKDYDRHVFCCRQCRAALNLTDRARRLCSQGDDYRRVVLYRREPGRMLHVPAVDAPEE
jgi:hypothetical protein